MIIIHNNLIPLGKARTINFFGVLFTKNKNLTPKTENHKPYTPGSRSSG